MARAVPRAETMHKPVNPGPFSNYLWFARSFDAVSIPQTTPGATWRSQKGASVTRIEQPGGVPDAAEVLRSIGDVAYEWRLDTDVLRWSDNAASVLGGADIGDIASGRSFAQKVEAEDGQSRLDAITRSSHRDTGGGVPYQVQYAFRSGGGEKVWLEDTGRWFAGSDGKPVRAIGIVRAINERHEREQALVRLANFDALTGEMNRVNMIALLGAKLDEAVRFRASLGFLLVAIDHLAHLNEFLRL